MPELTIRCGSLAGTVAVDPRALEQILGHLLENAQKYAAGSVVTVSSTEVDGSWVVVVVEDDGPGLPDDPDLFEPFARGDNATGTPGTGLGMHFVRTLAEASGGSVAAGSSEAGGARFEIRLPTSA
jgi:signal transduction histidine kinase